MKKEKLTLKEKINSLFVEKKIDMNYKPKFIFVGNRKVFNNSKIFELNPSTMAVRQMRTVPTLVKYRTYKFFWRIPYSIISTSTTEYRWQWKDEMMYTQASTIKKAHLNFTNFLIENQDKLKNL